MRSFNTWGARLCVAAVSLLLLPRPASAQFMTTDVPHIGVQLAEFAKKAANWVDQLQDFEVVKDTYSAVQTANEIHSEVRGLTSQALQLQQSIQANLRKVQSIKGLKVSNMTDLKNLALNLSNFSLSNALPALGQTVRFTQALDRAEDTDALIVKEALGVVSTSSGVTRTAAETRQQRSTAAMSQLALENKSQQDKITQAFQYKHMADELTTSATELQEATNTEDELSMTDGERLATQARATEMLLKAQELREKSSALLASAAEKGPAQLASEKVLTNMHQVAGFNVLHHVGHPDEDLDD